MTATDTPLTNRLVELSAQMPVMQAISYVCEEYRTLERRLHELERAVKDAPHGGDCAKNYDNWPAISNQFSKNKCNCWKAALAQKEGL